MIFQKNFRLSVYGPETSNVVSSPVLQSDLTDIQKLFEYMSEVLRRANRRGLSAPQVGVFKQFIVIERKDHSIVGLVNPEITRMYGREENGIESCASLPPIRNECRVPRLDKIDVEASLLNSLNTRKNFSFRGDIARVVQHELDHLTGTFIVDRASPCQRRDVLNKFNNWKSMRRAQIRKDEGNVNTGAFTINRG